MTVSNDLIERLSTETGRMMIDRARQGRRRALARISRVCVTVTTDGKTTREELFDKTPTLGDIVERVGPDAFIVSIGMQRKSLRERIRLALLAA
jgi:hypothetical protein